MEIFMTISDAARPSMPLPDGQLTPPHAADEAQGLLHAERQDSQDIDGDSQDDRAEVELAELRGRAAVAAEMTAHLADLEWMLRLLDAPRPDESLTEIRDRLNTAAQARGKVSSLHLDLVERVLLRWAGTAPAQVPAFPGALQAGGSGEETARLAAAEAQAEQALLRQNQLEHALVASRAEIARLTEAVTRLSAKDETEQTKRSLAQSQALQAELEAKVERMAAETVRLMQTLIDREQFLMDSEAALGGHKAEIERLRTQIRELRKTHKHRLDEIQHSTSWRVTRPLRVLGRLVK